jgi:hypothetical protein
MRFFRRSLNRSLKGELLWGHSKETLRNSLFSRNSLLVWILRTHMRRTKSYTELLKAPPMNMKVFRLRTENEIAEFFRVISRQQT